MGDSSKMIDMSLDDIVKFTDKKWAYDAHDNYKVVELNNHTTHNEKEAETDQKNDRQKIRNFNQRRQKNARLFGVNKRRSLSEDVKVKIEKGIEMPKIPIENSNAQRNNFFNQRKYRPKKRHSHQNRPNMRLWTNKKRVQQSNIVINIPNNRRIQNNQPRRRSVQTIFTMQITASNQ